MFSVFLAMVDGALATTLQQLTVTLNTATQQGSASGTSRRTERAPLPEAPSAPRSSVPLRQPHPSLEYRTTYSGYMVWLENECREDHLSFIEEERQVARNLREPVVHVVTGNIIPEFVVEDPVVLGVFPDQKREEERRVARHQGLTVQDQLIAWDVEAANIPDFQDRWNVSL